MPRACPVEPHAVSYCSGEREAPRDKPVASRDRAALCSGEREAPRDKPVASRAVWLPLIFKDHKSRARFSRRSRGGRGLVILAGHGFVFFCLSVFSCLVSAGFASSAGALASFIFSFMAL